MLLTCVTTPWVVTVLHTSFIYSIVNAFDVPVGQERLELSTPRLSSVCSNQLSYWPVAASVSQDRLASEECEY